MKLHAIFYTDDKFRPRAEYLKGRLLAEGFNSVHHYTREWLEEKLFYDINKDILDEPVGGGYWLWKSHIITDAIRHVDDGDVVFYMDAGDDIKWYTSTVIRRHMESHDYMIAGYPGRGLNKHWTKRDCFMLMGCDSREYWNAEQVEAGTIALKRTCEMKSFLSEWYYYCRIDDVITDSPNKSGADFKGFKAHRHDQSILTNLVTKYKMESSPELYKSISYNVYKP